MTNSTSELVARRGELLAELALQELDPVFLSKPTSPDVGYNFLIGFHNRHGGVNTFAVEVKTTSQPVKSTFRLPLQLFKRLTSSNLPTLLLVADTKHNELYFAWLTESLQVSSNSSSVPVPVNKLDAAQKSQLLQNLKAAAN